MTRVASLILAALLPGVLARPWNGGPVNRPNRRGSNVVRAEDRAQEVINTFRIAWDGYYKYAFPNDELHPVNNTFSNSRNGWGASAVDALSTALVMQQKDIVNQIIDYIPTIDYGSTSTQVSLFETTIRYLGGMLSGYDFLTGPLADLADNKDNVQALLDQSISLANALSFGFETPTGIPFNNLYFTNRTNDGSANGLATVGTLILEWTRLSDLSGNTTYGELAEKGESYLLNPSPSSSEPYPGLLGMNINVTTGQFKDAYGGWIGGADSYYEYLLKMFVYDPVRFSDYKDAWTTAADSTIKYLTSHPTTRPDLTFLATFNGSNLILTSQHLAGFAGGNFILGGLVLDRQDYIDYGLALTKAWHETYIGTTTQIGPEQFGWDSSKVPANQSALFASHGFYVIDGQYILRPEVIESYYYAYRATGNSSYQDWAWDAFVVINATTHTGSGYSTINNVNAANGGGFQNFQESFWFAEVLKYAYLIQAEEAEWQVAKDGQNSWVFNTEAHPFKVFGGDSTQRQCAPSEEGAC